MPELKINQEKITKEIADKLINLCPFSAISYDGKLNINSACKMCKLCVKKGPIGAVEYIENEEKPAIDKSAWQGITVFAGISNGKVHPVGFELLGKAKELAKKTNQPVYAVVLCDGDNGYSESLIKSGADKVFVYSSPIFKHFSATTYANAFEDFINRIKPSAVLVGATNIGRSLAPRIACRFKTGLTADCTALEIKDNTDLVQIRPAFGGNIMARILCPNTRPQFCTVRYKVFTAPKEIQNSLGTVEYMDVSEQWLDNRITVKSSIRAPKATDISEAEILVAIGRGLKNKDDLIKIKAFADSIGAELACSRPLAENGTLESTRQIGLSGKTVAPKLIITLGISGAVQFAAGMKGAECIIAVNSDPNAPVFDVAHYCVVGDMYEVLDELSVMIKEAGKNV
jgi:electron transfer flavoprotein alpha subunit